jgi:hypothetical protein
MLACEREADTLLARQRKNYRFALSPISTTLALSPISTRRQMASERDLAATYSAHASTRAIISAGGRMPTNGSPPVAGRPFFVFASTDFFIPRFSVRIRKILGSDQTIGQEKQHTSREMSRRPAPLNFATISRESTLAFQVSPPAPEI